MVKIGVFVSGASVCLILLAIARPDTKVDSNRDGPTYTAAGDLSLPDYRRWIFLTSGMDMNYKAAAAAPGHSSFDNVFVNPSAYEAFLKSGTWPDKTVFMLEIRAAEGGVSINKNGQTQSTKVVAQEVHVKDSHLNGGWGFFEIDRGVGKMIKRPAHCYQCHEAHAAVDTTFVQFYPTLIEVARSKGTFRPSPEAH